MAAGSAAERAEAKGRAAARKRGREVQSLPSVHAPTALLILRAASRSKSQFSAVALVSPFWLPAQSHASAAVAEVPGAQHLQHHATCRLLLCHVTPNSI